MVNNLKKRRAVTSFAASSLALTVVLSGCASDNDAGSAQSGPSTGAYAPGTATVENCGTEIDFPSPAEKIYVNEGQMLLTLFALEADDQIAAVSGIRPSRVEQLEVMYGAERVSVLPYKSDGYMNLETILAEQPDVVMAGYGWGFSVEKNITPDRLLSEYAISAYTYTPTCLPGSSPDTESMEPWEVAYLDLENAAEITGKQDKAQEVIADLKERRATLEAAPQADEKPSIMYATTVSEEGISSGGTTHMYQAVIGAAGAVNAFPDIAQASMKISWETVTAADPDVLVITDTGDGNFEGKIAMLESHPATMNLTAVVEKNIIKIPTDMGRSGALLMDSAEVLRHELEKLGFVPDSGIEPQMDLSPLN